MENMNKRNYLLVLRYLRLYIIIAVIYFYLERENYNVLQFHVIIPLNSK